MNIKYILILFVIFLTAISCNKEGLVCDLERNNSFDVNFNKPCSIINCETLSNTTTYVDKILPSSSTAWYIGSGYLGNGFALTQSCYGGYIEFSKNITSLSKMTFWTKSINPGYPNRTPIVTVDGIISNTTMINGSSDYTYWMQLETQNILSGNHTIRINFTHISTYYSYYIDQIEIWCQ